MRNLAISYFFLITITAFGQSTTKLAQHLSQVIEEKGIPGLSLSIIQKGELETTIVGLADREKNIPLSAKHRMLSGSIGKTYFAAQVMMLVAEGQIDLEKKAIDYLGDEAWFRTVQNAEDITIRSLMNHTSGVPEYVYAENLWKQIKAEPNKEWTAAERLAFVAIQDPHFPVGQGWSYADANYIILGAIVEKVTGRKIYDLVQENILDPLELKATTPSIKQNLEGITAAYTGRLFGNIFGDKVSEIGHYGLAPQFEWTGGGFITNSADLAKWIQQLYTGQVVPKALRQEIYTPVNRITGKYGDLTGYGLGAEIFATKYGIAYGHTGFMPGFLSLMAYLPDYDLAVGIQINTDPYNSMVKERFSLFDILETVLPFYIKKNKGYKKTTLYLVRHAEKSKDHPRDPNLSQKGQERSANLAAQLSDTNISAIYSTPYKRTQQTGQALAKQVGLEIRSYSPTYATHIFDILANNQGKKVLVVGHSNTVPNMVNWLCAEAQLPQLGEKDYGDLFEVQFKKGKGKLSRSKF
ncbi:MAG: serine hydrolase [Bacteroidota bacterium]